MSIRVHAPETDRLSLSHHDWILVKRYLNAGEFKELMRTSAKPIEVTPDQAADMRRFATEGRLELDPVRAGTALVMAYLLDWSFQRPDGSLIVIAGQPEAVRRAALDAIDPDAWLEVQNAIGRHEQATKERLALEKKTLSTSTDSSSTLTSVA